MLDDQMMPAAARPLTRSLGIMGILLLTLSVATPASSVFVIVPAMFRVAGTGAVWAMVIAGVVCVATAFIYAELSSAWPVSGGEYVAVAHTLGPMAGFVMLGVNVFNNLLFPPLLGLGIADVMRLVLPGLPQVPTALGVVALSTLVAVFNIRVNALVTGVFLLIEVVALVVVAVLGFTEPMRSLGAFLLHPVMPVGDALAPASFASIGVATSIAIFALNGYGAAVYFGEEMREAPRDIAKAILAALALTLLLEGVPIVAVLAGAPDLHALLTAAYPFGLLIEQRGGAALSDWISIAVVVAIVNATIACILACARFFYGTGRDGSWGRGADRWLVQVHPRLGSPWVATLLTGGVGLLCCLAPMALLTILSATGLVAIYAGIALAAVVGRRTGATAHAPYRMPLYPLAPIVTLLALAYVVFTSWIDVEQGRPGLIATAIQIVGSAAYYHFVLRGSGWTARIPDGLRETGETRTPAA